MIQIPFQFLKLRLLNNLTTKTSVGMIGVTTAHSCIYKHTALPDHTGQGFSKEVWISVREDHFTITQTHIHTRTHTLSPN